MSVPAAAIDQAKPVKYMPPDKKRLVSPYLEAVYKKVPLNLRVPRDVREGLEGLVRLWRHIAEVKGQDAEEIDITYVAIRLLKIGLDGAWGEVGGRPTTEAEWQALLATIDKSLSKPAPKGSSK